MPITRRDLVMAIEWIDGESHGVVGERHGLTRREARAVVLRVLAEAKATWAAEYDPVLARNMVAWLLHPSLPGSPQAMYEEIQAEREADLLKQERSSHVDR